MRVRTIVGMLGLAAALSVHAQSRGELLYSTHCMGCHTAKMHWRDGRAATDWPGLVAQVQKWQVAASLSWTERDVAAVTRYLNDSFYHFPPPARIAGAPAVTVRDKAVSHLSD